MLHEAHSFNRSFKMKYFILLSLLVSTVSMAASESFLCVSESPRGAIALSLNPQGESIGRQSNPYTKDWNDLLLPDKDMWDNLFVGYVEKKGPEHFTFNASVYRLVKHPQVIALTKSELNKNKMRFFIGDQRWMEMTCKKVKGLK